MNRHRARPRAIGDPQVAIVAARDHDRGRIAERRRVRIVEAELDATPAERVREHRFGTDVGTITSSIGAKCGGMRMSGFNLLEELRGRGD